MVSNSNPELQLRQINEDWQVRQWAGHATQVVLTRTKGARHEQVKLTRTKCAGHEQVELTRTEGDGHDTQVAVAVL